MAQVNIGSIQINSDSSAGKSPGQDKYGSTDFQFQGQGTSDSIQDGGQGSQQTQDPSFSGTLEVFVDVEDENVTPQGEQRQQDPEAVPISQEDPCPPRVDAPPSAFIHSEKPPPDTTSGSRPKSGFGWYSDDCEECCEPVTDKIINYLELKVATFTSPAYSPRLAASCDPNPIVEEAVAKGHATVKTINLKSHRATTLDNVMIKTKKDGRKVHKFRYPVSFPISTSDLKHLEVVTYLKLDHDRFSEDFDINNFGEIQKQSITEIMKFKTTIEKVITNGKAVEDSYVYVDSKTGEVWDGPVHYHPGTGFMAGAKHTPFPHAALKPKPVPNVKIKNRTTKKELLDIDLSKVLEPKQSDIIVEKLKSSTDKEKFLKCFISEPIESRTSDGKTRFLFYVDQKNLVKNLCRFPGFAEDTIYDAAPIKELSIFRRRGTTKKDKNEFGIDKASNDTRENQSAQKDLIVSTSDESSSQISSTKNRLIKKTRISNRNDRTEKYDVGSVEEISVNGLGKQRVFSIEDSEIADFKQGKYQYSVEIKFQDPTIDYLNQKLHDMCMAKDALQDIHYVATLKKNYNATSETFSDAYRNKNGDKHTRTLIKALAEIVEFLTTTIGRPPRRVLNYFLAEASVQTGSPQGVRDLIEVMESLERKFVTLLDNNIKTDQLHGAKSANRTKIFSKERSSKGILDFEKDFDFVVDRSEKDDFGTDFVGASIRSFPSMTASEYRARQMQEQDKYFSKTQVSTDQTTVNKNVKDQATKQAVTNTDNSFSYLTPASINLGNETLKLVGQDNDIDNIEKQNQAVSKLVQKSSTDSKTYFEKETDSSMSFDTLAAIGVSAYSEKDKKQTENRLKDKNNQGYTQKTTSVFGKNSFGDKNIDKEIEQNDREENDFMVSAVKKCGNAINDKLAQTGILREDAPINQDQEIKTKDPKKDFTDKLSIKDFDLNNESNIVKKLGTEKVSELPPSVKSLLVAREQGTRNWLDFEKDLLQDPDLKNIYRLNHANVVKVEYLEKVKPSKFSDTTKDMVYKPLTPEALNRTPLLVRIREVTIPEVGVGTDSGIKSEMYTKNFLIGPASTGKRAKVRKTNIADRKRRITNYIRKEMERLVFKEPSEITTHLNTNC